MAQPQPRHVLVPPKEQIQEKSMEQLETMAKFLIRHIGPQLPLPTWWREGGRRQVDERAEEALSSILLIWHQSELPVGIRQELDEVEAWVESLWEGGGPVYAPLGP